tara:strand:- start:204 stop:833 length:630 start_codon:yes stop_codon:yes gene_type:complete
MKAKICGLTETNQIETCIKYGASMCGFVMFYPQSHRNLSLDKAKELTSINSIKPNVAVLVNPSDAELNEIANLNFHYYQIYGDLEKDKIYEIKKRNGVKIIKALTVDSKKDVMKYKKYESVLDNSDIFLLDSKGYERSLSWDFSIINAMPKHLNKMVAGNIKIEDLERVSKIADNLIVDVSGSLETKKKKDLTKIKEFLLKIKEINERN